jgi:hypothetical protein
MAFILVLKKIERMDKLGFNQNGQIVLDNNFIRIFIQN